LQIKKLDPATPTAAAPNSSLPPPGVAAANRRHPPRRRTLLSSNAAHHQRAQPPPSQLLTRRVPPPASLTRASVGVLWRVWGAWRPGARPWRPLERGEGRAGKDTGREVSPARGGEGGWRSRRRARPCGTTGTP
jgi:hypothetical protein